MSEKLSCRFFVLDNLVDCIHTHTPSELLQETFNRYMGMGNGKQQPVFLGGKLPLKSSLLLEAVMIKTIVKNLKIIPYFTEVDMI